VRLSLITAPTTEPVTVEEAALHCRVDQGAEDLLLARLITAARLWAEAATRRAFITQTWEARWDGCPDRWPLELPKSPLVSVTHVKYLDTGGDEQTWASTNYRVLTVAGDHPMPGRLALVTGSSLPSTDGTEESFWVRFIAGYGAASAVPAAIKQAILLLVGEMYARREEVIVGTISTPATMGAKALLANYVVAGY
jgi:uncharacterized phiE125 gp8 family phage protein